jgi:hypothetical protein
MRRLGIFVLAGTLGIAYSTPYAIAQSDEHMWNDEGAIHQKHNEIRHDRRELRHDLRNGDYGAAREEQGEINARKQQLHEQRQDLQEDQMNRDLRNHDNDMD